tara:strand:- start:2665 stop:3786 length:1122 start_codon:yes stop_codon:yes gene_type:complete
MAPELALKAIKTLPLGSSVLDPMCGSGTSLKIAADLGIRAVGVDLDPMATLISSVWSRNFETDSLETKLKLIVHAARDFESSAPITSCAETNNFIAFWFGPKQAAALHAISTQIHDIEDESDRNFFSVALSRIIITKVVGASLAWDVSHSRPHRKKIVNDFDTIEGFEKSSRWMIRYFDEHEVLMPASVLQNDARHFKLDEKFDLVVTSPPYLNAIDYMRGHKLALVWLGHTIPSLREIRAVSIGAERGAPATTILDSAILRQILPDGDLPQRQQSMFMRFISDSQALLSNAAFHLKPSGNLTLVVANSHLKGRTVRHNELFRILADHSGLKFLDEHHRTLPANRRYLPTPDSDGPLSKRMKTEFVLQFEKAA